MSKRLQMLLDNAELAEIRKLARRHRLTTAAWVRQALRATQRTEPGANSRKKLATLRAAASQAFPTANIDQGLAQIGRGYVANGR